MMFSLLTATAIAANDYDPNKGTVAVNVADGSGNAISGNWYLHQFNINGIVPRNGSSSEVFQINPSTYYLEARLAGSYGAYWLKSTNPQPVSAGQTITFDLVYYATQEAKEQAQEFAQMQASEAAALAADESVTEEIVEPAVEPAIEEVVEEAVEPAVEEVAPVTVTLLIPNEPTTTSDVPTFETPPSAGSTDESYELGAVTSLVQTGPAAFMLLIPSAMAGLYFAARKRK